MDTTPTLSHTMQCEWPSSTLVDSHNPHQTRGVIEHTSLQRRLKGSLIWCSFGATIAPIRPVNIGFLRFMSPIQSRLYPVEGLPTCMYKRALSELMPCHCLKSQSVHRDRFRLNRVWSSDAISPHIHRSWNHLAKTITHRTKYSLGTWYRCGTVATVRV